MSLTRCFVGSRSWVPARGFLQSPDATATDQYFRACTGLAHPIANLLITRDADNAGLLSEAVTPLCVDAFPSCVFCLGPPSQEVDALLTGRGFQWAEELPDYRGRGLGGFATGEPLRMAADAGYKTSILQASQMGAPVYRRLGYESAGVMPFYVRNPGN